MNEAKIAEARRLYARGVCPGCGAALGKVAGQGIGHVAPNSRYGSQNQYESGAGGAPIQSGPAGDNTCSWTADQLTALVHIGSGYLASLRSPC